MTNSIADIMQAQCILAIGTNTSSNHPVIGTRVRRAVVSGAKLIVIDPFKIPLARYATLFLQPQPGTNIPLLLGMARVIIDEKLHDQRFIDERCENFDAFKASLEPYHLDYVAQVTGLAPEQIVEAACLYASHKPAAILYGMGITHYRTGTENVMTVGNLAMLTGNIGKPGSGVNPLRGQNNVQGTCDMGGLPNVFPGYQVVTDPAIREKFARAWKVDHLPESVGLTIPEMYEGIARGEIKALYMVGENPALTEPDLAHVRKCLEKLELFVCHDIFPTETTAYAHVVLPAAAAMESEGTFSNTERRVQWLNQVVPPPGDAKPNWWIVGQVAKRMGGQGFEYHSAADILSEINQLTPEFCRYHAATAAARKPTVAVSGHPTSRHADTAPGTFHARSGPIHRDQLSASRGTPRFRIPVPFVHHPQTVPLPHAHHDRQSQRAQPAPGPGMDGNPSCGCGETGHQRRG